MDTPKMPKKLTTEQFVEKATIKHDFKYDYSNSDYIGSSFPIKIICPKHGEFEQIASYHLSGNGCTSCFHENFANIRKKSIKDFIKECQKIHNNYYDYSKVNYINNVSPIQITCPKHGDFCQSPTVHRKGGGCVLCHRSLHLKHEFIKKSNYIHNFKYDYSSINQDVILYNEKVEIICPKHGKFAQQRRQHLMGRGCPHPSCCRCPNSKMEKAWIKFLNISTLIHPHRLSDLKMNVDGYDPITNTVYEFYGDFWHGNPKKFKSKKIHPFLKITFKKLHEKTIKRENKIKKKGYNLISIWESDWLKHSS